MDSLSSLSEPTHSTAIKALLPTASLSAFSLVILKDVSSTNQKPNAKHVDTDTSETIMVFVILMLRPLKNAASVEDLMVPAISVKLDFTLSMENAKNQILLDVLRKIMLVFASTALQVQINLCRFLS